MMSGIIERLQDRLDPARVHQRALDLVSITSPTGDSWQAAEFYAECLREMGLSVQLDEEFPDSPTVIAYLDGDQPGPTLELGGHLDTIPVAHDPPVIREGVLYGRGAEDMKGGMAAVLEVARVLASVRDRMKGRLMVCAWGLHEAPLGRAQSVRRLIERGILGDAVIVAEGPSDVVAVIGKGMSIYEITVQREGTPVHELGAGEDVPHPLWIGVEVLIALKSWAQELSEGESLPYVGPESLFVGQFEGGDFYNRVPTECRIVGTRRYGPDRRFPEVQAEFEARLEPLRRCTSAEIRVKLEKARDGFRVREEEPLVRMLQAAYEEVTGEPLPAGGFAAVGDVSDFVNEGGVPALYYGPGYVSSHSTPEYVALADLERQARVLLGTAARFLGIGEGIDWR